VYGVFTHSKLTFGGISVEMSLGGVFLGWESVSPFVFASFTPNGVGRARTPSPISVSETRYAKFQRTSDVVVVTVLMWRFTEVAVTYSGRFVFGD